jgi:hypothetical protein
MRNSIMKGAMLLVLGAIGLNAPARAQDVADFYKTKNVELFIGYSVGGGYDIYGRLVARHIGRFLPGSPTVIPRNMEGAGSVRLTNWLDGAASRDGSVIGTISREEGLVIKSLYTDPLTRIATTFDAGQDA